MCKPVLHNILGGGLLGVTKCYKGVGGWGGVNFAAKKRYIIFEWPPGGRLSLEDD